MGERSAFLTEVFLFLETGTGTAVTFFFTREMDLLFAVSVLSTRGRVDFSGSCDRRVLTFPSGRLLLGEFDVKLFFDGSGGSGLRFAVPIGRWEDAEGDGDTGLKVQIDDFCCRERIFSYNLP